MRTGRGEGDAVSRRRTIVDLISSYAVSNQAQLGQLLEQRGYRATQATLSRDLKALGIGKVPAEGKGYVYVLPAPPREVVDQTRKGREIETFVHDVRLVNNLALVRTEPGNAHGVARAIDHLGWADVEGTISGDDTVLVVTESPQQAEAFRERLSEIAGRSFA
jgi:transcriptional regulator of arginine metabolism